MLLFYSHQKQKARPKPRLSFSDPFLISPSQRRLIIAATSCWSIRIVVSGAGAPQRGLVAVLLVIQPALVLDPRQSSLHGIELAGGHQVVRPSRQDRRD